MCFGSNGHSQAPLPHFDRERVFRDRFMGTRDAAQATSDEHIVGCRASQGYRPSAGRVWVQAIRLDVPNELDNHWESFSL